MVTVADAVAVEEPLEIRLGFGSLRARERRTVALTMRTPGHDRDLAAGFLFTEGIIEAAEDLLEAGVLVYLRGLGVIAEPQRSVE